MTHFARNRRHPFPPSNARGGITTYTIGYTKTLKKKDALLKPQFDRLPIIREQKSKKELKLLFSAFICDVPQLSSFFSLAAMLKNVEVSQNPLFKNTIRKENQIETYHFHSFRIS